jgi:hypothetical protein
MPWNDDPYTIMHAFLECSEYTLKIPNNLNTFLGFHTHLLKRYILNDLLFFPNRELSQPRPIVTENGTEEWYINKIVDARQRGHSVQYLICYEGYGRGHDEWHPGSEMAEMDALDRWEEENGTYI